MKRIGIVIIRILSLIILFIYIALGEKTYAASMYESNGAAWANFNDNIIEHISDCLGKDKLKSIVNENKPRLSMRIFFDLDGKLNNIQTKRMQTTYFADNEWESIFDYISKLPQLPLPNCYTYLYFDSGNVFHKEEAIGMSYNSLIKLGKIFFNVGWNLVEESENSKQYVDSVKPFDILEKKLYNYKSFYRTEHPDSLFGLMRWEEVKRRYHDALKSGEYKEKPRIWDLIYDCEFDDEGYNWEKIPIKNYSVNIQVPIDSKITIATDSLSAMVDFPDSTYVNIQYTKGDEWTKLYETETNPRKRQIYSSVVTEKYLLSSGEFELNGKMIYWQRIRYRYGVTVTLYTSAKDNLTKYYSTVIAPITVVLRPKFKTIYLNDDGY